MRKILLSTSAMIGLAFATGNTNNSVANNSQDPELKITGKTTVSTYFFSEEKYDKKYNEKGLTTRVENSKIKFNVKGSTDTFGGLDYSLLIALSGDISKTNTASETVIKLGNASYGELSLGDTPGPDGSKTLGAKSILGGLGGFTGDLDNIINVPGEVLWSNGIEGSPSKATKLVYISPRIEGLQLAASYTPNTLQKGSKALRETTSLHKKYSKHNFVGLVSYENTFNGIDVGLSFTLIKGTSHPRSLENDQKDTGEEFQDDKLKTSVVYKEDMSWAIGGKIGYYGWEIGAEYIDNKESFANTLHYDKSNSGKIKNLGISYKFGASKISAGFYHSEKAVGELKDLGKFTDAGLQNIKNNTFGNLGKAEAQIYSLTYDYKVAPGLSFFAEANHFILENSKNAQIARKSVDVVLKNDKILYRDYKNTGQVLLFGTKVSF